MTEAVVRYIAGVVLCAVIAVAYTATRKHGARQIAIGSVYCFAAMMGVIGGVATVVLVLSALK